MSHSFILFHSLIFLHLLLSRFFISFSPTFYIYPNFLFLCISQFPIPPSHLQQLAAEKQAQLEEQTKQSRKSTYTFTPTINPASEELLQNKGLFTGSTKQFIKRQEAQARNKQLLMEHTRQQSGDPECIFQPQSYTDDYEELKRKAEEQKAREEAENEQKKEEEKKQKEQRKREEMEEKRRKEKEEEEEKEALEKKKEEDKLMREKMGEKISEWLLTKQRAQEKAKEDAEVMFNEKYTFHPQINPNSERVANTPRVMKNRMITSDPSQLQAKVVDRERMFREAIMKAHGERELKEMAECTFTPSTTRSASSLKRLHRGPVYIRGLSSYLELQDRARKMNQEKKERLERISTPAASSIRRRRPRTSTGVTSSSSSSSSSTSSNLPPSSSSSSSSSSTSRNTSSPPATTPGRERVVGGSGGGKEMNGLRVAVMVIPMGSEGTWMFSTFEGQQKILGQMNARRMIFIQQSLDNVQTPWDVLKQEV